MKSVLLTSEFWIPAMERAIRTMAQTMLGVITADGTGITPNLTLISILSIVGISGLGSILTSITTPTRIADAGTILGEASYTPRHSRDTGEG